MLVLGRRKKKRSITVWKMVSLDPREWRCLPETLRTVRLAAKDCCGSRQFSIGIWSCSRMDVLAVYRH